MILAWWRYRKDGLVCWCVDVMIWLVVVVMERWLEWTGMDEKEYNGEGQARKRELFTPPHRRLVGTATMVRSKKKNVVRKERRAAL
jgi:hypothetical protein